jgi:cytochrome c-type protein NapB
MHIHLRAATLASLLALACGPLGAGEAIDPDSLGLEKGSVFDTPTPPSPEYARGMPGTTPALPDTIPGGPPQIPHSVESFTPIKPGQNLCMGCHGTRVKMPGMATPMPDSHYTDLRADPDKVQQKVDGSRYICTTCHAPQADNPDLVVNTFGKP